MKNCKYWVVGLAVALASRLEAGVVISEIMYHPASNAGADEFIELHNPGAQAVDLTGYCFDGVDLCFLPGDSIGPGVYLVLGPTGGATQLHYGVSPYRTWDPATALDDSGEHVALLDATQTVVDELTYGDIPPWPVKPDGLGYSLERVALAVNDDTARNFHASTALAKHTAGTVNS